MSKYSYAQEKQSVLQQNPSNSLPPLYKSVISTVKTEMHTSLPYWPHQIGD